MPKTKARQLKAGDFVRCNEITTTRGNGEVCKIWAQVKTVYPNLLQDGDDIVVIEVTVRASELTYDSNPEEQRSQRQ